MTGRPTALFALALGVFVSLQPGQASGAAVVSHQVVVGDSDILNTWPGPDGELGTADDVVSALPSPINFSASNSIASYSYNAFDFGGGTPELALLPDPMNAVTFLQGSVSVDEAVAAAGGGPIVTNWNLMGTEPFIGHGPYSSQVLIVNSGTYDTTTHAFTLNLDFVATLVGGTANGVGFALSGQAFFVDLNLPSPSTGNAYVDNVLIPVAQGLGSPSLFYIRGTGTVPASTGGSGGSFPQFPVEAAIVAVPEPTAPLLQLGGLGALAALRQLQRSTGSRRTARR